MAEPVVFRKAPIAVPVEAGKSYYWCACGRTGEHPCCDGAHKGTGITPVKFEATESKTVYLCGCRHPGTPPFCDGAHKHLP